MINNTNNLNVRKICNAVVYINLFPAKRKMGIKSQIIKKSVFSGSRNDY